MPSICTLAVSLLSVVLLSACSSSSSLSRSDTRDRRVIPSEQAARAFDQLLNEQWQYELAHSPEFASIIGDKRYNDRWSDYSSAAVAADRQATVGFLAKFQKVNAAALDGQRQLSLILMQRQLQDHLEAIRLRLHEMLLEPVGGVHLELASDADMFPFDDIKDYRDYIKRLQRVPALIDQVIEISRQGAQDGLTQPRYLLKTLPAQIRKIAEAAGADSPFASPLKMLDQVVTDAAQRAQLRAALITAIDQQVRPAYETLAAFVQNEYAAKGREHEGLWSLPDGEARYRFAIHTQTTTDHSPEDIHRIGLREVARIEGEMTAIAISIGYKDLASFRKAVASDKAHFAEDDEQILGLYRGYIAGMHVALPKLFEDGDLPKTPLEVRAMPAFRREAPGAEYLQGTPEGSKPAIVMVNTNDAIERTLVNVETTAYHEGVPGHHLQISLAQRLPLPPFRQHAGYNAYVEGWALYAERLGKEAGFFKDPYSDYGRLAGELLRANRLVLDTGVHYKRWTRQQMVDFFHAHPSDDEPSIQAETDRYIVWPGQALGYKLGEMQILRLRAKAEKVLGARFDLRAFHDVVLGGGAMPLDVLAQRIDAWIAQVQGVSQAKR
ncbi:DUF885 family protein [Xylella fastidiosa subsp. multiplex]|uniref:DUF885 domain-containing protein n=1 Tax=Xylella fastidiosa TaxID=2371 RepID=UPI0014636648|nr:DUF885 family protein [Xylella fastidiosa]QJP47559.1 DUF885 family protein [Xylella fastidiosa subsp. multiplex]